MPPPKKEFAIDTVAGINTTLVCASKLNIGFPGVSRVTRRDGKMQRQPQQTLRAAQ